MKKLAFVLALLFALPAVFAADLSDYPAFFTDVSIVINDGNATDVQSAFMIANALQAADIDYQIRMASEIADPAGMQVISVGNNPITTAIINANPAVANYTLQSGQARITMYENGSIVHVVVYGNSIADTQKGAYVLANHKNFALDYKDTIVTGTVPSLNLSRVMTHIDYSCGGNQSFGADGSWPTPCIGAVLVPYFPLAPQPGSGGNGTNGSNGTGGNQTGGNSTGGNQTGGNQTGGNQTGGNQTGGNQTGGNQTGGNTTVPVTPGASLTLSNVLFGDDDQNRGENVTATATLTNTGTVALSGFGFTGLNSKYNLQVAGFPSTLASGQTANLSLTAFVPFDLDGVDSDCEENPVGIGTLSITTAQGATATDSVEMQAVNELAILDVFTIIAGEKKKVLETKLIDIYQEDDVEVLVELKNRFSTDDDEPGQDQTIDVEVKVTGDTDEIDLDESEDVDIGADDEDSVSLSGTVEDDARGNTKLILTAEGKDDNGALHCDQTLVKFNVIDGVRSAIRPAGTTNASTQPSFTPFPTTPKQTTTAPKPAVTAQPEPRQENVETIAPPVPVVSSGFRDSKVYVAWLVSLVLLMLSVIAAEAAFLIYKRKKASASLEFQPSGQQS